MTTSSSVVDVSSFSTTAKFRTWGLAVSTAIQGSGLTLTSDTGQVNWTTVTYTATANLKIGYEIYRFNDSLQSTAPIFLRLDYGTSGVAATPGTWLTVGTGTDGAGNITGAYFPVTQANSLGNTATNTTMTVRASYSTGAGAAFIDAGIAPVNGLNESIGTWLIQRTCDATGAPTGQGASVTSFRGSTVGVAVQYPISFSPYAVFASRNPAVGVLNTGSTSVSGGGVIELYRNYITAPTPMNTLGSLGYLNADIAAGAVFSAAPWGSTAHGYLALGETAGGPFEQAASVNIGAAVIWE